MGTPPPADILPNLNERDIHKFLTESLYHRMPLALSASAGVAVITLLVIWNRVSKFHLLWWSLAVLAISLLRYMWFRKFIRSGDKSTEQNWYGRYLVGIFLAGLVWASLIWIMPKGMPTEYWIFVIFILGGMMAGSSSTSGAIMFSFLAFSLPICLSVVVWIYNSTVPFPTSMSMLVVLYVAVLVVSTSHLSASMRDAFRLRFANIGLVEKLTQEQHHSAQLVQELEHEVSRRASREQQLDDYNRLLEMLAHGEELSTILKNLNIVVENQLQGGMSLTLVLDDQNKRRISLVSAPNLPEAFISAIQNQDIGMDTGNYSAAFRDTTVVAEDIDSDPHWLNYLDLAHQHNLRSCWSTPIRNAFGRVLGTLTIYHHTPYKPSQSDLDISMAAANFAGIAIEAKQTELQLQNMAHYDQLTQLPNRSFLYDKLSFVIAQAKRRALRFALLFIDLDDFKKINDTYGHETGDRTLQAVSRGLKLAVRDSDVVSRFGGDEFVILLTNLQETGDVDHVVRKILGQMTQSQLIDQKEVQVGGSIGISLFPDDGLDADSLIQKSDQAMYRAKKTDSHYSYYSDLSDPVRKA